MSKPYTIRYLSPAQKDLIAIFEYISKDNPTAAGSHLERFDKSISQLALNPLIGVIPNDERLKKFGYRMLILASISYFMLLKAKLSKYAVLFMEPASTASSSKKIYFS